MTREIKGWHVLTDFVLAFGVIISVNLTLAYNAVHSFPGLEVKNSYVASQTFDADRDAQVALGWDVEAWTHGERLWLSFAHNGDAVEPVIEQATFGRATSVVADQTPNFVFNGTAFEAPVDVGHGAGNWNLRLKARAADGTLFQQRIIVRVDG